MDTEGKAQSAVGILVSKERYRSNLGGARRPAVAGEVVTCWGTRTSLWNETGDSVDGLRAGELALVLSGGEKRVRLLTSTMVVGWCVTDYLKEAW